MIYSGEVLWLEPTGGGGGGGGGARPDVRFCQAVCARDHMNFIGHPFSI